MPYDNERIDAQGWSPDGTLEGADWIKQSWPFTEDTNEFLDTYFSVYDRPAATVREEIQQFMLLPVANHMPDEMRAAFVERGFIPQE